MRSSSDGVLEIFNESIPRRFKEGVLRLLFNAYRISRAECHSRFEPQEAANLWPFYRREVIEQEMRTLAKQFRGMTGAAVRDPSVTWWYHTRIVSGQTTFTQNAVTHPQEVVRPAYFRQAYAVTNRQKYLSKDLAPDDLPDDWLLYSILIHGRSPQIPHGLGFAHFVFPRPDLEEYYTPRIDLFSEFPQIVAANMPQQSAGEDDGPNPELNEQEDIG